MYTANDARREVRECLIEGYGFSYIRVFLHDLARARDITWEECSQIMGELARGEFGNVDCGIKTF